MFRRLDLAVHDLGVSPRAKKVRTGLFALAAKAETKNRDRELAALPGFSEPRA